MKDAADKNTIDAFGGSAKRGRPAKYASSAEKQKAYRARVAAENAGKAIDTNAAIEYALNHMIEAPEWVIESLLSLKKKPRTKTPGVREFLASIEPQAELPAQRAAGENNVTRNEKSEKSTSFSDEILSKIKARSEVGKTPKPAKKKNTRQKKEPVTKSYLETWSELTKDYDVRKDVFDRIGAKGILLMTLAGTEIDPRTITTPTLAHLETALNTARSKRKLSKTFQNAVRVEDEFQDEVIARGICKAKIGEYFVSLLTNGN